MRHYGFCTSAPVPTEPVDYFRLEIFGSPLRPLETIIIVSNQRLLFPMASTVANYRPLLTNDKSADSLTCAKWRVHANSCTCGDRLTECAKHTERNPPPALCVLRSPINRYSSYQTTSVCLHFFSRLFMFVLWLKSTINPTLRYSFQSTLLVDLWWTARSQQAVRQFRFVFVRE